MLSRTFSYGIVLVGVLFLPACGPRNTRYFPQIKPTHAVVEEQKDLRVAIQLLSDQECDDYFGVRLSEHGYRVLQLRVDNFGGDRYTFCPSYLDLAREAGEEIAKLMHYDTYSRVYWLTLPAFFLLWEAIPMFVVPYGLYWRNYNQKTTRYISQKTLEHDEVLNIAPYETVQKFIFVRDYALVPVFDIMFFNETCNELLRYTIDLVKKMGSKR